uniref:AIG1-type G domain-containing protein n=1 Tax=Dicentrarchus labrax TaxID=13489 RepID=A0A8P4KIL4_DICLA
MQQCSDPSELRIVLVGRGKNRITSVRKILLGSSEENEKCSSGTKKCQRKEVKIGQQNVVIVETDLCNLERVSLEEEKEEVLSHAAPGPHVFLFVLSCKDRFTTPEQKAVEMFKETFSKNVTLYTMVLFTGGEELEGTIEEFVGESDLTNFVDDCKGNCHVIKNNDESPSQRTELLQHINNMVQKNGEKFYTKEKEEPEKEGKEAVFCDGRVGRTDRRTDRRTDAAPRTAVVFFFLMSVPSEQNI